MLRSRLLHAMSTVRRTTPVIDSVGSGDPSLYLAFDGQSHHKTLPLYKTRRESLTVGMDMGQWLGDGGLTIADVECDTDGLPGLAPSIVGTGQGMVSVSISGGRFDTTYVLRMTTILSDGQRLKTLVPIAVLR